MSPVVVYSETALGGPHWVMTLNDDWTAYVKLAGPFDDLEVAKINADEWREKISELVISE